MGNFLHELIKTGFRSITYYYLLVKQLNFITKLYCVSMYEKSEFIGSKTQEIFQSKCLKHKFEKQ